MHVDFTIPRGLEITPSDEKKLKRAKKNDKKSEGKNTGIPFNLYIVYYWREERLKVAENSFQYFPRLTV